MYTSGTTAKPKGILHTSGGYLTHVAATHSLIFDLKPEKDVFWTAADIGWVTGHSYIVYGPLANGATSVMYEGTPDTPTRDRWWDIVERYKVNILYTAPTTIRTFMKWGEDLPAQHDLSSLRLLGSVGEPINPEAWIWYRTHIGGGRCPVVDTWWQTETGGILISPLPGVTATKPGAAMTPFPGVAADVIDNEGRSVGNGEGGYLVLTEPWPGMLRGIYGDDERYQETYWSRFPGRYFAGDGAKRDEDGDLWLLGRVDDVMNISGHRISTTEVEHALVGHPAVAEAAVVGASDATTGQAIVAFVTVKGASDAEGQAGERLVHELRDHVAREIGPIAKPRQIMLTPELPKTRSGKIMRRLLRDVADDRPLGDVTTLLDPTVVNPSRTTWARAGTTRTRHGRRPRRTSGRRVHLQHRRRPHAAAGAQRPHADAAAAAAQLVDQGHQDARPRGADGVPDADRPAVDVDDVVGEPELARAGDRHRREGLVDLDEVHVGLAEPGPVQGPGHAHGRGQARCGRARCRRSSTTARSPAAPSRAPRRRRGRPRPGRRPRPRCPTSSPR